MGPTLDHLRQASVREAGAFFAEADPVASAVTGVLRGQLKVRGDTAKPLQLSSAIDFPKAR